MQHVQEANLVSTLVDVAKADLDARERNHVFVSVGAGDSFTAIRILIKLIADKQIPLHPHLVHLCTTWLQAYTLHEDYAHLRRLVDTFAIPVNEHRSRVITRSIAASKRPAALAISVAMICASRRRCRRISAARRRTNEVEWAVPVNSLSRRRFCTVYHAGAVPRCCP
jgi:hypothetical protein